MARIWRIVTGGTKEAEAVAVSRRAEEAAIRARSAARHLRSE